MATTPTDTITDLTAHDLTVITLAVQANLDRLRRTVTEGNGMSNRQLAREAAAANLTALRKLNPGAGESYIRHHGSPWTWQPFDRWLASTDGRISEHVTGHSTGEVIAKATEMANRHDTPIRVHWGTSAKSMWVSPDCKARA